MENTHEKVRQAYGELTRLLIEKGLTVTTMESATAGQIASLITDTEGSSAVLKGGYVAYSNEAKVKFGVSPEVIERYSVYSPQTARAMAQACADAFDADIGIGITGTMGNADPANAEHSVPGQVWYAVCFQGKTLDYALQLPPQPTRLDWKMAAAWEIVCRLLELCSHFLN